MTQPIANTMETSYCVIPKELENKNKATIFKTRTIKEKTMKFIEENSCAILWIGSILSILLLCALAYFLRPSFAINDNPCLT